MAFDTYIHTDTLGETPRVPEETWCPECGGPPTNERAAVAYCLSHMPARDGSDDRLIEPSTHIFYSEAGGQDNVLVCNRLHRKEVSEHVQPG